MDVSRQLASHAVGLTLILASAALAEGQQPYSDLVVFGDSLSDVGNVLWLGTSWPRQLALGRFSNGPVWVEHLASYLDVTVPVAYLAGGSNYAVGGATTGAVENTHDYNMDWQVEVYLAENTPSPDQLFVVWIGTNDFWGEPDPPASVNMLTGHLSALISAGAQNFLVANLSPHHGVGELMPQFNSMLSTNLSELRNAHPSVSIIEFDFSRLVDDVFADPALFGLTNVMETACRPEGCWNNATVVPNPEEYWYLDYVHPSARAHEIIGDAAFQAIWVPGLPLVLRVAGIYTAIDNDSDGIFDDLGDAISDRSKQSSGGAGEVDSATNNFVSRLIAKFDLPHVDLTLESATLRLFLEAVQGEPAGALAVWHSVSENDLEISPSDYEDDSYTDTQLDLVGPASEAGRYYELDVTDLVLEDYAADGANPLSAFRLQINEIDFVDDDQEGRYRLTMPGAETNQPELVLTFIPEPSTIALGGLGVLGLVACRWRRKKHAA